MPATINSIHKEQERLSDRVRQIVPSSGQLPPQLIDEFRELNGQLKALVSDVRSLELTYEQMSDLYGQIAEFKAELQEGLIRFDARYAGAPQYKELHKIMRDMIQKLYRLLLDLRILIDAYEGTAPSKIRRSMGKTWRSLLDHILLSRELDARQNESEGQKLSLQELKARHGL